ncbi:MAG: serine hydrolase [Bryobacterales bacterium]|nr:serine hydrolase [Bryobacterales bacterium]
MTRVLAALACVAAAAAQPPGPWPVAESGVNVAPAGGGSGLVIHRGRIVASWGDPKQRYDLKSTTKSIGTVALGLALADGKASLEMRAGGCLPEFGVPPEGNRATDWLDRVTLRHLAAQTGGFDKNGGFTPLLFEPGTRWSYSDGGPNWLADCLTVLYGRDLEDLLFERAFGPLGITRNDLRWRPHAYREPALRGIPRREFGSGVHANVDAMARIGWLFLRQGRIGGKQILPADFVQDVRRPAPEVPVLREDLYPKAAARYGLLWWHNAGGGLPDFPRDAFWSWGLYDSLIVVVPSMELIVARAGPGLSEARDADFGRLEPLLNPIADMVRGPLRGLRPPYPPSRIAGDVGWADYRTIVRMAQGSDNWPMTWGDDDAQYTAYGDGWGFDPKTPEKLSIGFAKVTGPPEQFEGINIRTPTGERKGDGRHGPKASGLLMAGGVLYLWTRNTGNAQLAWSEDRGRTWAWADWRLSVSFGHPAFLQFGKNYAGSRDGFVYAYSPDSPSAYEGSDHLVLARAPSDRIREQAAWQFFSGLDSRGRPRWSRREAERKPVFTHAPGHVYRTQVNYNAGLGRYLMVQIIAGEETRFYGGFGIYEAPEPWGPWSTVYFTERWDTGPGESANLPVQWMSEDGLTLHMVFSGDDAFSVRKLVLRRR